MKSKLTTYTTDRLERLVADCDRELAELTGAAYKTLRAERTLYARELDRREAITDAQVEAAAKALARAFPCSSFREQARKALEAARVERQEREL